MAAAGGHCGGCGGWSNREDPGQVGGEDIAGRWLTLQLCSRTFHHLQLLEGRAD